MKSSMGLLSALLVCSAATADDAGITLSNYLAETPALVVVVCGDDAPALAAIGDMVEQTPWTIFCPGANATELEEVREWAREKGILGDRVYVVDPGDAMSSDARDLCLASDMADAVWIAPGVDNPPSDQEILRVLRPGGVAVIPERVIVKPISEDVDQWRHPYHEPDNNVVSRDRVARLPGELRFQTQPVFAAMPNQSLLAGGRLFFFSGHIAFHEREEPMLNKLTVLNAYNGLQLWERPLDPDYVVHNVAKLATDTEVVFAEGETLRILDAATGDERGKFQVPAEAATAGDTDWKWLAQDGDTLWAAFGPPDARVAPHRRKQRMGHWPWNIANEQYRGIVNNFGAARRLAAFQYPEMKLIWSVEESEPFDVRALCMEGGRIFQLASRSYAAARDASNGDLLWRQTPETASDLFEAIGDSLRRQGWGLGWATYCWARASDGVVCIAGPPFKRVICINSENGELLWSTPGESPHPFFLDDLLYMMPRVAAPTAGCRAFDPRTGEMRNQFDLGVIGSCTRLTVTPNQFYYRPGGGEGRTVYFDLAAQKLSEYEGVVRPGCFDGVVPANGRLYWMPLACDCWQVHGTFSMAPRSTVPASFPSTNSRIWSSPTTTVPAAGDDWPMFRADAAGTATVSAKLPRRVRRLWQRNLTGGALTAPASVGDQVFLGCHDGTVQALDADSGQLLWSASADAAVLYPPAYWKGRVVVGSCDGAMYCLDAASGKRLGKTQLAPQQRYVNIMGRLMSAWPLGGGVVVDRQGTAFGVAGSTAADGAIAVAVNVATGSERWRQEYTLDRDEPKLSFGVQANILASNNTLYINGGAPVGVVALDAETGDNPRVVARLEAGMEMFLEPGDVPSCSGPELYCDEPARTTIFKRHQNRVYFKLSDRHIALVDGRLFCARDRKPLDQIVELMNTDPLTGGRMGGGTVPWDVMQVPIDQSVLWASEADDIRGLAVGTDGLVVLHADSVEGVAVDGRSLWHEALPAPPVRWGVALTARHCVVTLAGGHVVCLGSED